MKVMEQSFDMRAAAKRIKPLRQAVRAVRAFQYRHLVDVWQLRGSERSTGAAIAVTFAGPEGSKHYLSHLVFGGVRSERHVRLPRAWLADPRRLECMDADAIVQETPSWQRVEPPSFWIPCWVGGTLRMVDAERRRRQSVDVKKDMRRVRRLGVELEIASDRAGFETFYHDFYVPYVRAAYGDRSFLVPWTEVEAALPRCKLLWIRKDGERIAGQMLLHEYGRVRTWCLGVKEGRREWVEAGAIGAIYHLGLQHLASRGLEEVHLGASRPFLSDGVLRYKRKWGMRLVDHSANGFRFTLQPGAASLGAFLERHPFVHRTERGLEAAGFVRDAGTGKVDEVLREFGMVGLRDFTVHDLCKPSLPRVVGPSVTAWRETSDGAVVKELKQRESARKA